MDSMEEKLPIDSCELVVVRITDDYQKYAKWNPIPPKKVGNIPLDILNDSFLQN